MSKDGKRALTAGSDGVVRVYDLVTRKVTTLHSLDEKARAMFLDDNKRVALFSSSFLEMFDIATGTRQSVALPGSARDIAITGTAIYSIDVDGKLNASDLTTSTDVEIPMPEKTVHLALSPSGRWLAVEGVRHLYVLDREGPPGQPATEVFAGKTRAMQWGPTEHLGVQIDGWALDVAMTPVPSVALKVEVGARMATLISEGRLYTLGQDNLMFTWTGGRPVVRQQLTSLDLGIHVARNNTTIVASATTIYALSESVDRTLHVPGTPPEHLAASSNSPYVVAVSDGNLLVWDLDKVQGQELDDDAISFALPNATSAIVIGEQRSRWLDLATMHATPIEHGIALVTAHASPSGSRAVTVDVSHHARVLAVGGADVDLGGDVDDARFIDENRVLLQASSAIRIEDLVTHTRSTLFAPAGGMRRVRWDNAAQTDVRGGRARHRRPVAGEPPHRGERHSSKTRAPSMSPSSVTMGACGSGSRTTCAYGVPAQRPSRKWPCCRS